MRYRRTTLRTWEGEEEAARVEHWRQRDSFPTAQVPQHCVCTAGGTVLGPKGKAVAPNEIGPGGSRDMAAWRREDLGTSMLDRHSLVPRD